MSQAVSDSTDPLANEHVECSLGQKVTTAVTVHVPLKSSSHFRNLGDLDKIKR